MRTSATGLRAAARPLSLIALALVSHTAGVVGQANSVGYDPTTLLSATPDMLQNDPTGRAHLLSALGNPPGYFGNYQYPWPEGEYNIDPRIDPAVVTPIPGNQSPQNGTFKVVGNSGMIGVHAIPFPNGEVLFYGRPNEPTGSGDPGGENVHWLLTDDGNWTEIAAIYNSNNHTFEPFHIEYAPFCGAQTLLPDGRAVLMGGEMINLWGPYLKYGATSVQVYDSTSHEIALVNEMPRARWYPTVVTMPDGNILVVGGSQEELIVTFGSTSGPTSPVPEADGSFPKVTLGIACLQNGGGGDAYWDNPSYEIYNPYTNELYPALALKILMESFPLNLYPKLFVLPSGSVLVIAGVKVQAMFFTPSGATQDQAVGILPDLYIPIGAQQYTPVTMLELAPPLYAAKVLLAGGTSDYCGNNTSLANDKSYLIDVTPGADHSIQTEQMNYRRVMGDLTLLPDGRVFLCNGGQIGLGGGGGPRYSSMGRPTTVAEIYDPNAAAGQRWTAVGNSQIPRLYHSVSWLTPNAEVMITGSETTGERRVQIYTPDYLLTGQPRPVIDTAPATVDYNQTFQISFSNVTSVDRVVLTRLTAVTHTIQFDGRQVVLNFTSSGTTLTATAPPSGNIAPPGVYMLFIVSGGVPSAASFVSIFVPGNPAAPPLAGEVVPGEIVYGITGPAEAPYAVEGPEGSSWNGPVQGTEGYPENTEDPADVTNPGFANGTVGGNIEADGPSVQEAVLAGGTAAQNAESATSSTGGAGSGGGSSAG